MLLSPKSVDNPVFNLSHYPSTALPYWHQVKMSNNWPTFVQDNSRYPETVAEAGHYTYVWHYLFRLQINHDQRLRWDRDAFQKLLSNFFLDNFESYDPLKVVRP
jgi:hypothetical protein